MALTDEEILAAIKSGPTLHVEIEETKARRWATEKNVAVGSDANDWIALLDTYRETVKVESERFDESVEQYKQTPPYLLKRYLEDELTQGKALALAMFIEVVPFDPEHDDGRLRNLGGNIPVDCKAYVLRAFEKAPGQANRLAREMIDRKIIKKKDLKAYAKDNFIDIDVDNGLRVVSPKKSDGKATEGMTSVAEEQTGKVTVGQRIRVRGGKLTKMPVSFVPSIKDALNALAQEKGTSMSALINEKLEEDPEIAAMLRELGQK